MEQQFSYGCTPKDVITKACREQCPNGYPMKMCRGEWPLLVSAVNQGIDSHLEGFTRSTFNSSTGECIVHPDELHILLRRFDEWDIEDMQNLRVDILGTLGIEEI